jgi:hypothetical protein
MRKVRSQWCFEGPRVVFSVSSLVPRALRILINKVRALAIKKAMEIFMACLKPWRLDNIISSIN